MSLCARILRDLALVGWLSGPGAAAAEQPQPDRWCGERLAAGSVLAAAGDVAGAGWPSIGSADLTPGRPCSVFLGKVLDELEPLGSRLATLADPEFEALADAVLGLRRALDAAPSYGTTLLREAVDSVLYVGFAKRLDRHWTVSEGLAERVDAFIAPAFDTLAWLGWILEERPELDGSGVLAQEPGAPRLPALLELMQASPFVVTEEKPTAPGPRNLLARPDARVLLMRAFRTFIELQSLKWLRLFVAAHPRRPDEVPEVAAVRALVQVDEAVLRAAEAQVSDLVGASSAGDAVRLLRHVRSGKIDWRYSLDASTAALERLQFQRLRLRLSVDQEQPVVHEPVALTLSLENKSRMIALLPALARWVGGAGEVTYAGAFLQLESESGTRVTQPVAIRSSAETVAEDVWERWTVHQPGSEEFSPRFSSMLEEWLVWLPPPSAGGGAVFALDLRWVVRPVAPGVAIPEGVAVVQSNQVTVRVRNQDAAERRCWQNVRRSTLELAMSDPEGAWIKTLDASERPGL
ncbi:MAG: hypothetical protein V3T72_14455, partial [Thermoanaerobaculia bacterium]